MRRAHARNGLLRPVRELCGLSGGAGSRNVIQDRTTRTDPPEQVSFPKTRTFDYLDDHTKIGSEAALRSCAERANTQCRALPLSRGKNTQQPTRVHTYAHEVNTMHVLVDLKICESCGSLWYRAAGEVQVYCGSCAAKLGEFPLPRVRRRPGGRRKHAVTSSGLFTVTNGGGR